MDSLPNVSSIERFLACQIAPFHFSLHAGMASFQYANIPLRGDAKTNGMQEWLEQLGLSKYAEVFSENNIDLGILADLTENDLQELGVSLEDRKRLFRVANRSILASESRQRCIKYFMWYMPTILLLSRSG